jgi:hypothetical protein
VTIQRLGTDGNLYWTAFGPTNAKLHRVNIAVTLGDAGTAVAVARTIDLNAIDLTERRAVLLSTNYDTAGHSPTSRLCRVPETSMKRSSAGLNRRAATAVTNYNSVTASELFNGTKLRAPVNLHSY